MKKNSWLLILILSIAFCHGLRALSNNRVEYPVRALYLNDSSLCDKHKLNHYIKLANESSINAYVIDVKGVNGLVRYKSAIPAVREARAWTTAYDLRKITRSFHDHHIRVIGRIACFMDPYLSVIKPDWAIKDIHGQLYNIDRNDTWLNPVNREVWKYLIAIAKESLRYGIDEIQFDYVRFPTDGKVTEIDYGVKPPDKAAEIGNFLAYVRKEMRTTILSADVFGIICESPGDLQNIGQNLDSIGLNLDYLSPMIYPALFATGQIVNEVVIEKPDLDPYGIVYNSLLKANRRISEINGYEVKLRPYLQAFTASWLKKENYQPYGPEQLKQQIKAAKDAGCEQWIFWNEENNYPEDAF